MVSIRAISRCEIPIFILHTVLSRYICLLNSNIHSRVSPNTVRTCEPPQSPLDKCFVCYFKWEMSAKIMPELQITNDRSFVALPFISNSDTRRQTSSRVRFPDQDDEDLLLDVLPFPEERLALQQQSQVRTLQVWDRRNLDPIISDNSEAKSSHSKASSILVEAPFPRGQLQRSQRWPQETETPPSSEKWSEKH